MKYDMTEIANGSQVQGVIQEFAIEAVRHQLGIPSNRSPSFSGALIMLPRCLYDSATNLSDYKATSVGWVRSKAFQTCQ